MADGDLKVFTSWSGDFARDITRVIRDWLPKMLDRVDPWMSDIDIQAGTRALQVIEDRLNESEFGIIVVTTANQHSTWLNFEAGALSKRFEGRSSRVIPVLVNFDSFYQIEGPIRQFQGLMLTKLTDPEEPGESNGDGERKVDKESMRELLKAVNEVAGTKWPMVEARFEWSWDEFEASITEVIRRAGEQPPAPAVSSESLLKEILDRMSALELGTPKASRLGASAAERNYFWSPAEIEMRERHMANSAARARVQGIQNTLTRYGVTVEDLFVVHESDGTIRAVIRVDADGEMRGLGEAVLALEKSGVVAQIQPVRPGEQPEH